MENKIASLVDTLKVADAAEKAYVLSRYCTSTHLHPENNVIVKASHGGNTDQQNKKVKKNFFIEYHGIIFYIAFSLETKK